MQFVQETGKKAGQDAEARKAVRSQAMRDFRRRQREQRESGSDTPEPHGSASEGRRATHGSPPERAAPRNEANPSQKLHGKGLKLGASTSARNASGQSALLAPPQRNERAVSEKLVVRRPVTTTTRRASERAHATHPDPRYFESLDQRILRLSKSFDEDLASWVILSIEISKLADAWLSIIPSRIGHSQIVDHAADATVSALDYSLRLRQASLDNALRHYGHALTGLRRLLETVGACDESLLVGSLLVLFERTLGRGKVQLQTHLNGHLRGLSAILTALPLPKEGEEVSEIAQGILYGHWAMTFLKPIALGTPSPYDHPRWSYLSEARLSRLPKEHATLRRISHALYLRLPRLTTLVRAVRQDRSDTESLSKAEALYNELCVLLDNEAEQEFIHTLDLVPTFAPGLGVLAPKSWYFKTIPRLEAGAYYWETRLTLLRLVARIRQLGGTVDAAPYLTREQEQKDVSRICNNILMCWATALKLGMMGRFMISIALGVWGATFEFPELFAPRLTAEATRTLVAESLAATMPGWVGWRAPSNAELDETAELFVGGPRTGWLTELFTA